ncbi:MAG: amidohydrolase family protein, partial [Candidatus Acidiferrales bacterium]
VRPLARLGELGLLGPGLIAVHAIHLERNEIDLLAQHGCHVAHCPSSNLKLASGFAPIAALLKAGVKTPPRRLPPDVGGRFRWFFNFSSPITPIFTPTCFNTR